MSSSTPLAAYRRTRDFAQTPERAGALVRAPRRAALPETLAPQLATLVADIPPGGDWLYEIKFDGYRLLTRADGPSVRCMTRNGQDWSHKLPHVVEAIRALDLGGAWLDGEIVVTDARGVPDFQALQNAFGSRDAPRIRYQLFDLPFDGRHDLREWPLEERRARLRERLAAPASDALAFSESFEEDPKLMLDSARRVGLEGLIGKRRGSPYRSQRSTDWIKLKTQQRQEFVVGGFTEPKGSRLGIGSLLLGVHADDGTLRYAGNVGSGFDDTTLASLRRRLDALASDRPPFVNPPRRVGAGSLPRWVEPRLVAEVSFAQWTQGGQVRQPVFHGLRADKSSSQISKEPVVKAAAVARRTARP